MQPPAPRGVNLAQDVGQQRKYDEEMQEPQRAIGLDQSQHELPKNAMRRLCKHGYIARPDLDRQPEQVEVGHVHDPGSHEIGQIPLKDLAHKEPEMTKNVGIRIGAKNSTRGCRTQWRPQHSQDQASHAS